MPENYPKLDLGEMGTCSLRAPGVVFGSALGSPCLTESGLGELCPVEVARPLQISLRDEVILRLMVERCKICG
jgi:hypothetical protein